MLMSTEILLPAVKTIPVGNASILHYALKTGVLPTVSNTPVLLGFLNELFSALGTGDGDLALTSGDPDLLATAGTVKVPMLPVLQLLEEQKKSAVFVVPLVGLPGKASVDGPDHKHIGDHRHCQLHGSVGDEHSRQSKSEADT